AFCCTAEGGIRVFHVTGVQTCALPIFYFSEQLAWVVGHPLLLQDVHFDILETEAGYERSGPGDEDIDPVAFDGAARIGRGSDHEIGRASGREAVRLVRIGGGGS